MLIQITQSAFRRSQIVFKRMGFTQVVVTKQNFKLMYCVYLFLSFFFVGIGVVWVQGFIPRSKWINSNIKEQIIVVFLRKKTGHIFKDLLFLFHYYFSFYFEISHRLSSYTF